MNDQALATVQSIYQAFGRGDVPAIVAAMAPDVQWDVWLDHHGARGGLSYLQPRRGPDGVAAFFGAVAELQIHEFKLLDLFGADGRVAAEIEIDVTNPVTGRRFRDEELHLWTVGADGRVTRFRHYVDTAKHLWAAGRGGAVS